MKIRFLREVHSDKQRRWACAQKDKTASQRPESLSKKEAEEMCTGPMKEEEQLDEMSSAGGGAVQGAVGAGGGPWATEEEEIKKFNKRQKAEAKLDGEALEEMYSTSGTKGLGYPRTNSDDEHEGHLERSKHQGLKNVTEHRGNFQQQWKQFLKENEETETMAPMGRHGENPQDTVVTDLSDITTDHTSQVRVAEVYYDIADGFTPEQMAQSVMDDKTSRDRVDFMQKNMNYDPELYEKIRTQDPLALEEYYMFVINEFAFITYFSPKASPSGYLGRTALLGKGVKDILYAMTYKYIQNPNKYSPRAKADMMNKEAEDYELDKDLKSTLYKLPEQ